MRDGAAGVCGHFDVVVLRAGEVRRMNRGPFPCRWMRCSEDITSTPKRVVRAFCRTGEPSVVAPHSHLGIRGSMRWSIRFALLAVLFVCSCGDDAPPNATAHDGGQSDAAAHDAQVKDSSVTMPHDADAATCTGSAPSCFGANLHACCGNDPSGVATCQDGAWMCFGVAAPGCSGDPCVHLGGSDAGQDDAGSGCAGSAPLCFGSDVHAKCGRDPAGQAMCQGGKWLCFGVPAPGCNGITGP